MNASVFENAYLSRINTIMQSEEINLRVANALRFIIQNVFANIANTFVFTLSTSGGATEVWLHDLMRKLFVTFGLMAVQLVVLDSKIRRADVPHICYCNLFIVDSFESLRKTKVAEYNRNSDNFEYYFIFLQVSDNLFEIEANKIFQYCFENYWIHCDIMAQNSRGDILVYTYFPFKENSCFKTQPELINRFYNNKFEQAEMFPDKLKNLHGCPLKLSTWAVEPFVIKETNKRVPSLPVAGFEIFTLMTASEKMNFTLDVEWLAIDTYGRNVSPETAPLSKLKNYETNFTVGYFCRTPDRDKIATPSLTTYYIPLVAIILRKEAHQENIRIWTSPFSTAAWILILAAYILKLLLYFLLDGKIRKNIFDMLQLSLGIPLNILPNRTSIRILFTTALITSFILRSTYQSVLYLIFSANFYQSPPLAFERLVKDKFMAVGTELTLRFLINIPEIRNKSLPLKVINNTNEMHPLRILAQHRNERVVAMSVMEFAIRFIREELAVGDALQVLPINVKDQQICFYFPKHSYFADRISQYILYFHQAGLFTKWREWTLYDYQVVEANSSTVYVNNLMVNLRQLGFFLYAVLSILCASSVVFCLELASKRLKWMQKFFKMQ